VYKETSHQEALCDEMIDAAVTEARDVANRKHCYGVTDSDGSRAAHKACPGRRVTSPGHVTYYKAHQEISSDKNSAISVKSVVRRASVSDCDGGLLHFTCDIAPNSLC